MSMHATQDNTPANPEETQIGRMLQKIRWGVLIFIALAAELSYPAITIERPQILVSVAVVALFTLILGMTRGRLRRFESNYLPVAIDIALVGLVVYFSDGIQSPFYPLFYVTLVEAAATFGTRGALACAAAIAILSLGTEALDATQTLTEPEVVRELVRTIPYLFIVALITGALRDRVRGLATAAADFRAGRERLERDMAVARMVQRAQLPSATPELPGVDITCVYEPALDVGGDLYDFYPMGEDSLGITVADVAGKGVPAALLVASAKYAVRQYASTDRPGMIRRINQHIMEESAPDSFVALLHGVLHTTTREFRYVNAGQMPPIVVRASTGKAEVFEGYDLPVGVTGAADYTEHKIQLQPGDVLILYTDGLTDALGLAGDGLEALRNLLDTLDTTDLQAWREALTAVVESPLRADDITLVAVRLGP